MQHILLLIRILYVSPPGVHRPTCTCVSGSALDTMTLKEFQLTSSKAHMLVCFQISEQKEEVKKKLRERRVPSSAFGRAAGFAGMGASLVFGSMRDSVSTLCNAILYRSATYRAATPTQATYPSRSCRIRDSTGDRLASTIP